MNKKKTSTPDMKIGHRYYGIMDSLPKIGDDLIIDGINYGTISGCRNENRIAKKLDPDNENLKLYNFYRLTFGNIMGIALVRDIAVPKKKKE